MLRLFAPSGPQPGCASVRRVLARWSGIARSLAIYHGQPGRQRRLRRFYAQFLAPGDLAFDIGAHVGNRVRAWRALGVRVVAVEPQPDLVRVLRRLFGGDPEVVIRSEAVGAYAGHASLRIATAPPTVSSLSPEWIGTVTADRRFGRVRWDRAVEGDVVTLDQLVAAQSFEYLPQAHSVGLAALAEVERLDRVRAGGRSGDVYARRVRRN